MSYQVDPDALFSESDGSPVAPSPKRPRILPQPVSAYRPVSVPSSSYSRQSYNPPSHPPPTQIRPLHPQRPRPQIAPGRAPMGRGRAMTLPSHVTSRAPQPSIVPAEVEPRQTAMEKAASILPESQREKLLQEERRKNQQAVSERKRPSRRRRPQQPDPFAKQIVLENVKKARKTNPFGLQSLLKVAQNGGRINLDPDRSKTHRTKRTVNERAIYEHVTVTKEMKEREERDRLAEEQRKEQEELQLDAEFKDMREREREERMQLATEWRLEDTVASGMRYAYRLAKIEHTLFGEGEDKKKRDTLVYLGLELKKLPDNDAVTTLMTIEFDENDI